MDTHRLRISVSNMRNANTRQQLEHIKLTVLRNLGAMDAAPSAQLAPRPPAFIKVLLQRCFRPPLLPLAHRLAPRRPAHIKVLLQRCFRRSLPALALHCVSRRM